MNISSKKIICLFYTAFLSLFAMDMFGQESSFWETILALLINLIPSAIILLLLLGGWRWEKADGLLSVGFGVVFVNSNRYRHLQAATEPTGNSRENEPCQNYA